jgi:FlgD Ig-like domain
MEIMLNCLLEIASKTGSPKDNNQNPNKDKNGMNFALHRAGDRVSSILSENIPFRIDLNSMSEEQLQVIQEPQRQPHQIWGDNPTALLAALWVAMMLFWAVCDDVAAASAAPAISDRAAQHDQSIDYYLSGAESRPYSGLQVSELGHSFSDVSFSGVAVDGDIRISETVAPGRFWQSNPATCILADGSIIVAFEDERQGSKKIFLQKYTSSGAPVGGNVMIAGRADGFDLIEPEIVATVSNKFYLGYRDIAAGQVRVARINSDLSVDLPDFAASDNSVDSSFSVYAGPFALAARQSGEFAIAFESYSVGNTIALRRFSPAGALVSSTDAVNSDGSSVSHWAPDLAFDENGGIGVVWEDYRSGGADIFLRRFDSLGVALGNELNLIDLDAQAVGQFLPSLVFSGIHGFMTGWSDSRDGWTVYLQRFSKQPGIGLIGANLAITPLDSMTSYLDVDLAVSAGGLISATYCAYGASSDALAQKFDASLAPIGSPVTLASESLNQPVKPAIASGGHHSLVWELLTNGDKDIQLTVANSNLSPTLATPVLAHDDASGAVSDQADVAVIDGESVVTVFRDLRRDGGDIYVQANTLAGFLRGDNRLMNEDNSGGLQSEPSISANAESYVVVWNDQRFIEGVNSSRIYMRYGGSGGAQTSGEMLISGDSKSASSAPKATPSVALAPNGAALVAWLDMRSGDPQIMIRLLDSSRAPLGVEFQISDAVQGGGNSSPTVSVDAGNVFVVAWKNTTAVSKPIINVRRYNSTGALLGSFSFTSDQLDVALTEYDMDVDNSGKIFLHWSGTDNTGGISSFLTVFTNGGAKIGSSVEIPDNLNASPVGPSISVDEFANILMAWVDSRGPERRIYTQNFNADMTPASGNQPLSLAGSPAMLSPSTLAVRGRSWVSWSDARSEGMNVYLKGFVHFPTDVDDDDEVILPSQFALQQNFPNPFNPTTHIAFTLPQRANLTLKIYNILGQEIRELANRDYPAGKHQILWDGADTNGSSVASGIYFYRLKTDAFTETRKMTLLK